MDKIVEESSELLDSSTLPEFLNFLLEPSLVLAFLFLVGLGIIVGVGRNLFEKFREWILIRVKRLGIRVYYYTE